MVVGDIGGRHDQRRDPQCRQLADGGGPRPAEHQIRRPHDGGHIIDVLPHLQRRVVRQVHPLLLQQLQQHRIAILSGAVDVVERFLGRLQRQEVRHLPVHARGPQGPPEGHKQGPAVFHAQAALGLCLRQMEEVPPHRRTGDDHLLRVAVVLPAGLKPHHDPVREGLQHLRGEAGHHVGLVNGRGDPRLGSGLHHREAGVSPRSDDHVRPELPQNGPGLSGRPKEVPHRDQVVPDLPRLEGPVEAGDVDGAEVVSRLGDQVLLQSPLRSHEQKFCLRVLFAHQLGQRDSRVHVPGRAAAGEDHLLQ